MTRVALRTKLTLFYTGLLALFLSALAFVYYRVLALQLDQDASATLQNVTSGMHGYLRFVEGMPILVYDHTDAEQAAFIENGTRYYQVFDANDGRLLLQSRAFEHLAPRFTPADVASFRREPRVLDIDTDHGRFRISNTVMTPAPGDAYLLQVGQSLVSMDAALDRFLALILWSVPIGLVAAAIAGRWMAGRALAPLVQLAAATRDIHVGNLGQRLPVGGAGDELDEVAHAFNDTLARLDHAVGDMRQFSVALAHELRTPLAALRGETELTLGLLHSPEDASRALASQLEGLDKLARLISQLLTLARAEAGEIPLTLRSLDLGALAESVVDTLEPVAQARDITLGAELARGVVVAGDRSWIERLLLNLLDNAIKFTPPGGRILVRVHREGFSGCVEVTDTGIGIAPEAIPHLFERFYRVDASRSPAVEGTGLGLALAKWIADRHRGKILVSSRPGQGSTFAVHLPLVAAAHS